MAYVILFPPALESWFVQLGLPTAGLTRILATGALFLGIVAIVFLLLLTRGETFRDIGLKRPANVWGTLLMGLAIAAVMFAVHEFLVRQGIISTTRLGDMASELKDDAGLALARIGLSVLVVGFVEELLFRGFILDRVATAFAGSGAAFIIAIVAQAVLFGLSHAYQNVEGMIFTGCVGLAFDLIFVLSGRNLWPLIIGHSVFDGMRAAYIYMSLTYGAPF